MIDDEQEQLRTRTGYHKELRAEIIETLQQSLAVISPYVEGFKSCRDRLREDEHNRPIETMSVRLRHEAASKQNRGTHNRPSSSEVACVLITPPNAGKIIGRDIRVETKSGSIMDIPDWHPCYMALRYPILFPFGEQSWHENIRLGPNGDDWPTDHPLHARKRNGMPGAIRHHNFPRDHEVPQEEEELQEDREQEEANAGGQAEGPNFQQEAPDDEGPRGRGGSTRVTRRLFYNHLIQVSRSEQPLWPTKSRLRVFDYLSLFL